MRSRTPHHDATRESALDLLRDGVPVRRVAQLTGVPEKTLFRWRGDVPATPPDDGWVPGKWVHPYRVGVER